MNRGLYSYSMPKPYISLNVPSKFPEDIQCIIKSSNPYCGSLYISNIEAAKNLTTLKRFGIRAILTCAKGYELSHPPSQIPDYKYIPTVDHDECNISVHFGEAVEFIKKQLAKTNLLVHCIAGVSRSVSMVIAYLISERNMSYDEAYREVKSRRKIICPNDGFIKQLKEFHTKQKTIKRASSSPKAASKTDDSFSISINKTPIKENNYFENTLLTQYNSTYLTPYSKSTNQDRFEQTKSSQLSKTKTGYERPLVSTFKGDKEERPILNRTSTGYFSITKTAEQYKQDEFQRKYDYFDKPRQERPTPVSQRLIKIDLTPNKEDTRELTPKKGSYRAPVKEDAVQSQTKDRKGYFQNMNRDLSDKIDSIRKKYDIQRQKLFEKYQLSDKKIIKRAEQSEVKPKEADDAYPVKKKGSLPQQSSPNRYSGEGVKEEGAQKRYQDVKQYFSKSRMSYAQIYDKYTKKRIENAPQHIPADVYLKYNYDRQQKGKTAMERYRPYSQYERYPNRNYKDYLNYQADYSYKGY